MKKKKRRVARERACVWELRLYVADTSPRSVLAAGNLQNFCEQYLAGQYRVTIIDILKCPSLARRDDIIATPTLVRVTPSPQKTLVGSLSDTVQVLRALELSTGSGSIASLFPHSIAQTGSA